MTKDYRPITTTQKMQALALTACVGLSMLLFILGVASLFAGCAVLPVRPTVDPSPSPVVPPVVTPEPVPVPPSRPSGGESGGLRVADTRFYNRDTGAEWTWVGVTDFQLFAKYCETTQHGNPQIDLDAHLDSRQGFKVLRVLGMAAYLFRFVPTEFDYWGCLDAFLDHAARRGYRVEFVVFADAQEIMPDVARQQAHFRGAVDVLSRHWNALGELCNECAKNGVDPRNFDKPGGVSTLWSRGSGLADEAPPGPYWDFAGWHGRRDFPKVLASNEDMVYVQWGVSFGSGAFAPVAVIADEPIGVDETDQGGRRTANCNIVETLAYSSRAFGRGMTYHTEAGLFSRPFGPVQAQCADVFLRAMR